MFYCFCSNNFDIVYNAKGVQEVFLKWYANLGNALKEIEHRESEC